MVVVGLNWVVVELLIDYVELIECCVGDVDIFCVVFVCDSYF